MKNNKNRIVTKFDVASVLFMLPLMLMSYRYILRGDTYDAAAIFAGMIFFFIGIILAVVSAHYSAE